MAQGQVPSAVVPQWDGKTLALVENISTNSGSNSASRSTTPSCTERSATRKVHFLEEEEDAEEEEERIIVKSTFLDLDNGSSLTDRYKLIRKSKTDSNLYDKHDLEAYEPGKYSDEVQSRLDEVIPCNQVHQEVTEQSLQPVPPQLLAVLLMQPVQALPWAQQAAPGHREQLTTVMMKNIPNNYTRNMFLAMLNEEGFEGLYDFVYLPCDFNRDANLGYAFVNLIGADTVEAFWKTFAGFSNWVLPTAKVCQVGWSGPHQGLIAHVERYRNSPVMHASVRDEYKPVIFVNGVRRPFPSPTKYIKALGKTGNR